MTSTDICNLALAYLAKGRITSLTQNTEDARQCAMHYDHCRRLLLRSYRWGFARRIKKLALSASSVPGWEYVYGYPSSCLSVRFVFTEDGAERKEMTKDEYEVAVVDGVKVLCTDVEEAWCEYTEDVTEVAKMTEEFVEALARYLAASMAVVLTGNDGMMNMNYQLMQTALAQAQTEAAREREQTPKWPTKYAEARFG
jgi:hypothetical protein